MNTGCEFQYLLFISRCRSPKSLLTEISSLSFSLLLFLFGFLVLSFFLVFFLLLDRLAKLNSKMQEADAEKGRVLAEAQECQLKLDLAERLVNGLADENTRWTESVSQLENSRMTVVGDTMLASAFVSYVGAFTSPFRVSLIEVGSTH